MIALPLRKVAITELDDGALPLFEIAKFEPRKLAWLDVLHLTGLTSIGRLIDERLVGFELLPRVPSEANDDCVLRHLAPFAIRVDLDVRILKLPPLPLLLLCMTRLAGHHSHPNRLISEELRMHLQSVQR